jgi:hypothetical protein
VVIINLTLNIFKESAREQMKSNMGPIIGDYFHQNMIDIINNVHFTFDLMEWF